MQQSFPALLFLLRPRWDRVCGYKGLSHTWKFLRLSSLEPPSQSLEPGRTAALPPARLLLRSSWEEQPKLFWGKARGRLLLLLLLVGAGCVLSKTQFPTTAADSQMHQQQWLQQLPEQQYVLSYHFWVTAAAAAAAAVVGATRTGQRSFFSSLPECCSCKLTWPPKKSFGLVVKRFQSKPGFLTPDARILIVIYNLNILGLQRLSIT